MPLTPASARRSQAGDRYRRCCCPRAWSRPSSRRDLFASRTGVVPTSLAVGATRAPALIDGILAVDKHGQMTGGSGWTHLIKILISEE